jgi:hypothetical protein
VNERCATTAVPLASERQRAASDGVWGRSPQRMKRAAYKRIPVEVAAS